VAGALVLAAVSAAAPGSAAAAASHPLVTAMELYPAGELAKIPASGATTVRISLSWPSVAPATEPSSWDPSDPADPHYAWTVFDSSVRAATARGLQVLVSVVGAPAWAQRQPALNDGVRARSPDPVAFGLFAHALASRYSGSFDGLPRIKYFEAWNEPNISTFLVPQLINGKPVAPIVYRRMVNEFARAVHSVHRDNLVVAGSLAPFRDSTLKIWNQDHDWGPLSFMRTMLCVSATGAPTCKTRVDFDVWSMHPYTSGGPTHHAVLANDVSLGDLPKLRAVLAAAARVGHLTVPHPALWATEFSWDSNPPDPAGVPTALLTRWVAQGLYQMWANGFSLVTWFQIRDAPVTTSPYQSGLWYADGKPKPALQAFRFPFVALPIGGRVRVWGRTPPGDRGSVLVEQSLGGAWSPVATLTPNRYGIFEALLSAPGRGQMRAKILGTKDMSVPFRVAPVPDEFFNPFGLPKPIEIPK
jgi:hypothetical protein